MGHVEVVVPDRLLYSGPRAPFLSFKGSITNHCRYSKSDQSFVASNLVSGFVRKNVFPDGPHHNLVTIKHGPSPELKYTVTIMRMPRYTLIRQKVNVF